MTTTPQRILGFTRDEWAQARFDDPGAVSRLLEFFDSVFDPIATENGALIGIGPIAVLAIARVSPAFARRLRNHYDSVDPDWRKTMENYPAAFISGPGDPRADIIRSSWASTLALLDASVEDS